MSYVNTIFKFAPPSILPNLTCLNAGNFGVDEDEYPEIFANDSDPLSLQLLYFDEVTGTMVFYDCIDKAKFASLLQYGIDQLGAKVPASWITSISKLLNLGHFEVFFISAS